MDFAAKFWHCECVSDLTEAVFVDRYNKWCRKTGYAPNIFKAQAVYGFAKTCVSAIPKSEFVEQLVTQAVSQINSLSQTQAGILRQMRLLASTLPEYPVVMAMGGVGETLGPQLIAEIGDVRRFYSKGALVAFAGLDSPPFQSGSFESHNRHISKRGSPMLRRTLFLVMSCLLQHAPVDDGVYQYLDKKRGEGKHFYVYMMAGANKFLRIYYARINAFLRDLPES